MLVPVFLALFLPCIGMTLFLIVYICLLWYSATINATVFRSPEKPSTEKGLSASELQKLPKTTGSKLMGTECAVCLDEIERDQLARLLPGCNHGFHLQCADTWLSKNPVCPVCRAKLDPVILNPDENIC
ncbi:hypothetical protein HHK36_008728 [Tetracentron sinense]|uniref:RING-type domain-containing protein n=1 Tax=Tetracentron sinense TaxID=13715 RepID=A0A835DJK9_TETSI|nr:hypothetical protein HHK36_008728 [Tetracentron sinense]